MTLRAIEVRIRRAEMDDAAAIAVLFDGYRRFYGQSPDLAGARRFVESRLQSGDSVLFVADHNAELVGFTQLYPSFSSASMNRLWILNDLFVHADSRRLGVGRALMEAAENFAEASGAKGLVLSTQRTNAAARTLYEARGWKLDAEFDQYEHFF